MWPLEVVTEPCPLPHLQGPPNLSLSARPCLQDLSCKWGGGYQGGWVRDCLTWPRSILAAFFRTPSLLTSVLRAEQRWPAHMLSQHCTNLLVFDASNTDNRVGKQWPAAHSWRGWQHQWVTCILMTSMSVRTSVFWGGQGGRPQLSGGNYLHRGGGAHHATSSTAPTHQLLGSANAETTPVGAPAAAVDRTQRPDATCEGKNG